MSAKDLTKKQRAVLQFLCDHKRQYGFCPSYKDIAKHFNFSSDGTVRTYLEHLEAKRCIKRSGQARSIEILVNLSEIPILGNIQAGHPIDAIELDQGVIPDLKVLQYKDSKFALSVKGDSMINAGILDGDVAIIDKDKKVQSGDIIAAMIDHEVTLKRYIINQDNIILEPENDSYQNIVIANKDKNAVVIGKYVGLIRSTN